MASTITIDPGLDDAQRAALAQIFGVEGAGFDEVLACVASAALEEYVLAFTGVRSPSTIRELRELRLRLLYEHLPVGGPTDEQIARLFQMTPSQVATLIAGTRARFDGELGARLRTAAIQALEDAERVDEDTIRIVIPDSLARYLRDLVAQTSAPPLEKRKDASRTYDVGRSTVVGLCRRLGIDPKQISKLEWAE